MTDQSANLTVLTGSTSGLGSELAKALAAKGSDLVLLNRSAEKTNAQIAELKAANPDRSFHSFTADLLDLEQVDRAAAEIAEAHPRVDALWNNAGLMTEKRVMSPGGVESHFAVNTLAPFRLTNLLAPTLAASAAEGRKPVVANIASGVVNMVKSLDVPTLADPPTVGKLTGAYATSKMALVAISAAMADEMTAKGVIIRAVDPGAIRTNMTVGNSGMPWWASLLVPIMFNAPAKQAAKVLPAGDPAAFGGETGIFVDGKKKKPLPAVAADPMVQMELHAVLDRLSGE